MAKWDEIYARSGVPHHFFDEAGIREAFRDWKLPVLVERRGEFREKAANFFEVNPFDSTVWGVLARKPLESRSAAT